MADDIKTDATLPDVKAKDVTAAKLSGIKQAIAEDAAQQFKSTDGIAQDEVEPRVQPTGDVFHLADMLELQPDDLKDKLAGDGANGSIALSEGQIGSLLEVERSGKNRTDIVKVLCDRLGVKSPYEVTDAGPAWTNPVNRDVVKPRG